MRRQTRHGRTGSTRASPVRRAAAQGQVCEYGVRERCLSRHVLKLGLPENWIDLAALTLAALTTQSADTAPTRPPGRKARRKNRSTKRRTPRNR
ncbi:hypothetical protein OG978_46160 (plasmid) [Streptomyces sp. NBC_01591]|uniref:hypothetical protein n=1 Tax=Streptomyces sp. NBC_01591 TaxID=2975888 RepID=UPI002DD8CCBC|nr:hypothetical protein [Streptomyces sp. NBC_01591]WSD74423.1 hypothetical protein OG978_46160 [Streptomyces sp. NBC_01591]